MTDAPTRGGRISGSNGSDFKTTEWESKGGDDKGTRTSTQWVATNGGWNRTSDSHSTNQNVPKGRAGRHPDS